MDKYQVHLERSRDANGHLGSFGLSILGGYGTKFPAVVCEVDPGGPADGTGLVKVGDKLTNLNGEDLRQLTPKDLVNKIRTAPSPSIFTLLKDEELRQQVIDLLRKQEKKAAARRERAVAVGAEGGDGKPHKKTSHGAVGGAGQADKRKKVMSRIIEVEPSVNVKGGHSGEIVQVYHNQIIGVCKPNAEQGEGEFSPQRGGRLKSPRETSPSMSSGSEGRENNALRPEAVHRIRSLSPSSQATPSPEHSTAYPHPHTIQTPNETSQDNSYTSKDISNSTGVGSTVLESSATGDSVRENDSGVALKIPNWNGPVNGDNRASLSEAVLIDEIEKAAVSTATNRNSKGTRETSVESQSSGASTNQSSPGKGPLVDAEKRGELMKLYRNSPSRTSSSRSKDDPYTMAVSLARRLYMLDGFKKSEVAEKLSDPSEFGQTVAKEYLKFFEFEGLSLDDSLRQFLASFMLTGESQERERIIVHFSERYFSANPDTFPSLDTVHGLTVALLLLNTDLHCDHGSTKMSFAQFTANLEGIGVRLPKDSLRKFYNNIRKRPLQWANDNEETVNETSTDVASDEEVVRVYHVTIPGTFVEVELPGNAPLFKEGFVLRKNIMDGPHKKVPRGKRNWKPYYAYLKGFLFYFGEPQGDLKLEDTSGALPICHCLAMGAFDYNKKNSVLRVTTSDWHSFLLQASNVTEMQQWIGAINKAAALYSAAPLAAPMSSSVTFMRPTFPLAPTKNTLEQQIESHEAKIKSLEKEVEEHQAYKPTGSKAKHSVLQAWFDKYEFLQYQMNCYRIYLASLTMSELVNFNAPLPSGLVPSPSVSTLAVTGTSQDLDIHVNRRDPSTPPHSPAGYRKSSHYEMKSNPHSSPLAKRK